MVKIFSTILVTLAVGAELFNVFAMLHLAHSCVVRFLCLKWVSFMEETVGERATRIIQAFLSLSISIANCTVQMYTGDITSGGVHDILTREIIKPGEIWLTAS